MKKLFSFLFLLVLLTVFSLAALGAPAPARKVSTLGTNDHIVISAWDGERYDTRQMSRFDFASQLPGANQAGQPYGVSPLDIPTFDGLKPVTHPSVLRFPTNFAGYPYWMAFTPYPDILRELPSVVASKDGVNWEVPVTFTNPVITAEEKPWPGGWWADPELVTLTNNTMVLFAPYFWSGPTSVVTHLFRKEYLSDGTWSQLQQVGTWTNQGFGAPQIQVENDGSLSLWAVDNYETGTTNAAATNGIFRLSSDWAGTNWVNRSNCTFEVLKRYGSNNVTNRPHVWHGDIKLVRSDAGTLYHMLMANQAAGEAFYYWSTNGINWDGSPGADPFWEFGTNAYRLGGLYKPDMVYLGEGPRGAVWDVYYGSVNGTFATTNSAYWRIGLLRNVTFPNLSLPGAYIIPPAAMLGRQVTNAYSANATLFHKFTVTEPCVVSKASVFCAVSNGNIALTIYESGGRKEYLLGGSWLNAVGGTGIVPCPTAGSVATLNLRKPVILTPGVYALGFWGDSGTAQFLYGQGAGSADYAVSAAGLVSYATSVTNPDLPDSTEAGSSSYIRGICLKP